MADTIRPSRPLTVIIDVDPAVEQANAAVDRIDDGMAVVNTTSNLFIHQLRLRVQRDPSLVEKIQVLARTRDGMVQEVGLTANDELRWPEGFCQEAWEIENEISRLRFATPATGGKDRE